MSALSALTLATADDAAVLNLSATPGNPNGCVNPSYAGVTRTLQQVSAPSALASSDISKVWSCSCSSLHSPCMMGSLLT